MERIDGYLDLNDLKPIVGDKTFSDNIKNYLCGNFEHNLSVLYEFILRRKRLNSYLK